MKIIAPHRPGEITPKPSHARAGQGNYTGIWGITSGDPSGMIRAPFGPSKGLFSLLGEITGFSKGVFGLSFGWSYPIMRNAGLVVEYNCWSYMAVVE